MSKAILDAEAILQHATPLVHQTANEIQPYGHLVRMPIALAESACKESVDGTNDLLVSDVVRTTNCRGGSSLSTSSIRR
jgi:hypothetical protein